MKKESLQKLIGEKIKSFRESKNMSQQDLSSLCNMEKSNFSRLEAGRNNPTIYTLCTIAFHLGIENQDLVKDIKKGTHK